MHLRAEKLSIIRCYSAMLLRLRNSAEAMSRIMRRQESTANNLANANTVGYKKSRVFTEVLSEYTDQDGAPQSTNRIQSWTDPSQGTLEETGNPLDVALAGDGLFTVRDQNDQTFYTRAGQFSLDREGVLRDRNGYAVQGRQGTITISPRTEGKITISDRGVIQVGGRTIDQLQVVEFADGQELEPREGALLSSEEPPARILEAPEIRQGFVEASNVDAVNEMTNMIEQTRMFESQQRWLRTTDQLLGRVTRELGKF